jgi:hypothetical protein
MIYDNMKLNKTELKVLAFLIGQREKVTLGQLAGELGMKKSNASIYVKKLEKYGLATVSKTGRTKQISGSYAHFPGFSKVRKNLPHLRLEDILSGKMPYFLAYLDGLPRKPPAEPKQVDFGIKDIRLPAITTRRLLAKLSSLGMVYSPSKGRYSVRKEAEEALRFCSEILTGIYMAEAEAELKEIADIRISFEKPEKAECIFITDKGNSPKNYWPTAYTALGGYGIKLIGSGRYYYTNIKPEITDVVIHMLAAYKDARSIMYVCALMIKQPFEYRRLLRKENRFGISDAFILGLIEFIKTKGRKSPEGFPAWDELESMLKDYGIAWAVAHG